MGRSTGDIELNTEQMALFERLCQPILATDDELTMMQATQDVVSLLLRRDEDRALCEETLGQVSRFFLGIIKAADLSEHYRVNKLRMFAKATLKILLWKRPRLVAATVPPAQPGRRGTDASPPSG